MRGDAPLPAASRTHLRVRAWAGPGRGSRGGAQNQLSWAADRAWLVGARAGLRRGLAGARRGCRGRCVLPSTRSSWFPGGFTPSQTTGRFPRSEDTQVGSRRGRQHCRSRNPAPRPPPRPAPPRTHRGSVLKCRCPCFGGPTGQREKRAYRQGQASAAPVLRRRNRLLAREIHLLGIWGGFARGGEAKAAVRYPGLDADQRPS